MKAKIEWEAKKGWEAIKVWEAGEKQRPEKIGGRKGVGG